MIYTLPLYLVFYKTAIFLHSCKLIFAYFYGDEGSCCISLPETIFTSFLHIMMFVCEVSLTCITNFCVIQLEFKKNLKMIDLKKHNRSYHVNTVPQIFLSHQRIILGEFLKHYGPYSLTF